MCTGTDSGQKRQKRNNILLVNQTFTKTKSGDSNHLTPTKF